MAKIRAGSALIRIPKSKKNLLKPAKARHPCKECGDEEDSRFICTMCGAKIKDGERFFASCFFKLERNGDEEEVVGQLDSTYCYGCYREML
jgi:hypothetical protein